jgi:flagellar motor component MotA
VKKNKEKYMYDDNFIKEYNTLIERTYLFYKKAYREGLLSLEDMIDEEKYLKRDIFEYGMRLVIDGIDTSIINQILTNIVELEIEKDKKTLKTMQKEVVLAFKNGWYNRLVLLLINSHVNIDIEEIFIKY